MAPRQSGRWKARAFAAVGAAAVAALALALILVTTQGDGRPAKTTSSVSNHPLGPVRNFSEPEVTIPSRQALMSIPRSFLGFSTEYWTLPVDERHLDVYGRVLSAVHVPGDGPLILRIGGDSSDHTVFDRNYTTEPSYVFDVTPRFVDRTALVVREERLRVILDLNLITGSPRLAGGWAQYAERHLPRGSIIGLEIGNEPDLYDYSFWRDVTSGIRVVEADRLPSVITPRNYAEDFLAYARVLAQVAPQVPLYAPALANPGVDRRFISALLGAAHPGLRVISGHRYPYSGCIGSKSPQYPTIHRLLSEAATVGMAQSVLPAVRLAHHAGFPFVLTEFNSITCGGLAGVSNTFSSALWAPDAAFELLRAHIAGIHLHARQNAINDPFTFGRRGLIARPLLYGLILFARALGPSARLVPLQLRSDAALHLKVWAVKVGRNGLHVLLLNKGSNQLRVRLNLPASGEATLERLLALSPQSSSGVTLGGQWLNKDARWVGRPVRTVITPRSSRYDVPLPPFSAALLTTRITPGALK